MMHVPKIRRCTRPAVALAVLLVSVVVGSVGASPAAAAASFQPLNSPARVLDTRPDGSTADGTFAGGGIVEADTVTRVKVTGRHGVPGDAAAVMFNVTAVDPANPGFLTVFPCGAKRPEASTVNYVGATVPNSVIATVGDQGRVCIYSSANAHVLADMSGYFPTGSYRPLDAPKRVLDTRRGTTTIDGKYVGGGLRDAGSVTRLQVAGRGGIGNNASAVALNVTAADTRGAGYLSVFPCGSPTRASNVNYGPGQTVPNMVVSKIGNNGRVCIYAHSAAHLVVDVSGVLPGASFRPLDAPQRIADTRDGQATVDGKFAGIGATVPRDSIQLTVAGRAGIPKDASAVILNVTAVSPSAPGYLAVHPRGTDTPAVSNVNHAVGGAVANSAVARVGANGQVCVFSLQSAHVVVDVVGWLTGPAPPADGKTCPKVTTNTTVNDSVVRPGVHRAVGHDRIAVLMCNYSDNNTTPTPQSAAEVAKWANETAAPWFNDESRGRYTVTFEPHPKGRITSQNENCLQDGMDATSAPYSNVMVVLPQGYNAGYGYAGLIPYEGPHKFLEQAPKESRRGFQIGGDNVLNRHWIIVHEIGHTIQWPHTYTAGVDDYDNRVDVMSGEPQDWDYNDPDDLALMCPEDRNGETWYWPCRPQNTIAFNRVAAGWVDDDQLVKHPGGTAVYDLDRPMGAGNQVVLVADLNRPQRFLTIEARPNVGHDVVLGEHGVALHLVGQYHEPGDYDGISSNRFQKVALGAPLSFDHVLVPGESATAHGVTVRVLDTVGEGYRVEVSGTYTAPPDSD